MDEIELRIVCGRRLHFQLDVGCLHTYIPYRLRNKDKVLLRVLKELGWRMKEFEGEQSDGCFDIIGQRLERTLKQTTPTH